MTKIENFSMTYELSDNQFSPIKMRLAMWECTWSVISENLYFGTGTGDGHDELIKSYTTHNFHVGLDDSFNSHNMYLQFWMSNGIPGLLLFISILLMLMIKALKEKNMVFLLFIVLFACFSITEATMLTQRGIVFFLFFSSVFYWSPNFWNQEVK